MIPTHKTQISMTFDEYVVVKDVQNLYLSPPLEKTPKYKMRNKSLIVYFESDLDSNKTYVLDVSNAIADNNEGNMYPGYALVFSTGRQVDSMMMTGIVQDCNTLMPVKGATVMLYKDHSDSAIFKHRPDAAIKTDDWGFFCLRNIQDTLYRMYAIMDMNNNNIYEADQEQVAFLDTVVRPAQKVNDSLPELKKYIMTDTVACLARKTQYEMNLFKEVPSKQMILNKGRLGERTAYITFMAPYAKIDSIWMTGIPSDKLITQFNLEQDSLEIWVNDPRTLPDTLFLNVDYLKTDTLGNLVPTVEEVKLAKPREAAVAKSSRKDIKKEDTTTVFTITAEPETVEQYGFEIEFKYPLVEEAFDSLVFRYLNPKQQEFTDTYTVVQDSLNLRKYVVRPSSKLLPGYEYFLNGRVGSGHQIGRQLGFPTANLQTDCPDKLIPKDGVYAVHAEVEGKTYGGMLSIGQRPTLDNGPERTIEVHLFGFRGNIYGCPLRVSFVKYTRPEVKFGSIDELAERLKQDAAEISALLGV